MALLLSAGLLQTPFVTAEEAAATGAPAAERDAERGAEAISEVTVSARRRTENAQDVPIPIAAVDGESLRGAGRFRLEDLNQRLPSTNVQFNNPRQTSIAVRGLGNNPANDALESSVGVYLDNVYLGRASMANLDLIDLDQVALLRGPQGTLFGKNTTAGVLSISTKLPSFEPERSIDASYGDYSYYQLRGVWSEPLIDDKLAARVSFARTSRGGFVTNSTTGRDLNGSNRIGGRGQLLWKSGDTFSLRVIGDYNEEHSDTGAGVLYYPGPNGGAKYYAALAAAGAAPVTYDPDFASTTINSRQHMDVRQGGGSAEANWRFGDYTLTSITAYRAWYFKPFNDADGTSRDAIPLAGQQVDDHQWTQELRLASPAEHSFSYVVGLYYFKQAQDNLLYTQYGSDAAAIAALQLGAPAFANGYSQTAQQLSTVSGSVFGQVTWKPTEDWELAFGLRDTRERKTVNLERSATGSTAFVNNPSFAAYTSGELKRDDAAYSGLLSASYRIAPAVLGYVSVSRGAKSGGINPTAPVPGLTLDSLYVAPEVAQDAELGFKSTLLDRRLVLNANLFWTKVKDYQATLLLQPTGLGTFQQILSNVGKVRSRGVETDIVASPTEHLTLRFSASFNDAIYVSYPNAPCSVEQLAPNLVPGQKVCDLTGQQLVGAPKWIANPGVTYTHATFLDLMGTAQLDYSWRSGFFGTADNSQFARVPAYGLLNVRYGLQGRRGNLPWTFSVWSNNVLDKRYVLGSVSSVGRLYNYSQTPGLPRTVGATFSVDF
jgi:iron complex outermembrane receptor protein